jgi:thioesterase domain-containing protein/acyl carrier protein
MMKMEGVTDSVTIPYGEEERKRLVCYYTRYKGRNLPVSQVREYLSMHLPDYMFPSSLMEVDDFPLTLSNKIDTRALPPPVDSFEQTLQILPETETERKLIELFRSVLPGVAMDTQSNFFSLGGDSLDAVNLLSALTREFGADLPLRRFYELPDLRAIAKELDHNSDLTAHQSTHENVRNPVVPRHISVLQPNGDQMPLFIVYGDRANTFLPGFLGSKRPLYTLLPLGSDGEAITENSVESIASLYLREIEDLLPDGKYHLAGFSFGGLIALEMALQLWKSGRETGRIAVIDTVAPHLFRSIIHKVSWQNKIENWMKWIRIKRMLIMGKPVPPAYRNAYVLRSFRQAACRYSPETSGIQLPFRLIKSARSISSEPDLGWSLWEAFIPEITTIDGDHFSIIRDPEHVRQYATLLVD